MLESAHCESCDRALPLRGARWEFRLPPERIDCPGCARAIDTTFPYRVTWMEALLLKLWVVPSLPIALVVALRFEQPVLVRLAIAAAALAVGCGLGGLVVSRVLGFPATLTLDLWRRRRSGRP